MIEVMSIKKVKRSNVNDRKRKVQVLEIKKGNCQKVRKTKTDPTFFGDIPYIKGKPFYKINKNANPDFVFLVSRMTQRIAAEEKFKC